MYEGSLNHQIEQILKSCGDLSLDCSNTCPLHKVCREYLEEQNKKKERPVWKDFTPKQIEMAAQSLFEEMLTCSWDIDILCQHSHFWTDEQKLAYREMSHSETEEIDEIYIQKVMDCLKDKSQSWLEDILGSQGRECPLVGSFCTRPVDSFCDDCPL